MLHSFELTRVLAKDSEEMQLRDFRDAHEEWLCQRHLMLSFITFSSFLEARTAHYEFARRDQHELHADWVPQLDPHAQMFRPGLLVLFRLLRVERCDSGGRGDVEGMRQLLSQRNAGKTN